MRIITHKYNCSYKILCISILFILLTSNCGNAPQEPPAPEVGSIQITTKLENIPVDSMLVLLDNDSIGIKPNPYVLTDIVAGKHQVAVFKDDPQSIVDFSSRPSLVTVNENDTSDVTFALTKLAPNFTIKKLKNDEDVTLSDLQGKAVLLVFYSLGWSSCKEWEIPTVQDSIVNKFSDEQIVVFGLTPNEDPYQKLKEYVADKKLSFDMLYNADEVFDAYGVTGEPTHVLIDKDGQIRFRADNTFYFFRISILIAEIQKII